MAALRTKEQHAEFLAHVLDDFIRVPRRPVRLGIDPLLGLVPIAGDALATLLGTAILVIARQLHVPWNVVASMAYNLLKNGLIGSVPFVGDAYSFYFKSHAINAALLLRAVRHGEEGTCALVPHSLTIGDVAGLAALTVPILVPIGYVSWWFWVQDISYLSLLFSTPAHTR